MPAKKAAQKAAQKSAPKAAPAKVKKELPESEGEGSKKHATAGAGCDPGKISSMLSLLKYRAGPAKCGEEDKADAAHALSCYQALADPKDRARFLADFDKHGGGKGPGSLKFAVQFKQSLKHITSKEAGSAEDFYARHFGGPSL